MLIDIFIISVTLIFLEKKIIGNYGYILFSPVFVFISAYNLLFIIPSLLIIFPIGELLYMAKAPQNVIADYVLFNRIFFYTFTIFLLFFTSLNRKYMLKKSIAKRVKVSWFYSLLCLGFILKYLYLGTGLGFDPFLILERALFPREFTSIKVGTGLINYLQSSVTLIVYFLGLIIYLDRRTKTSLFFLIISGLLFFVGGGKQQILWLFFVFIMVSNKTKKLNPVSILKNLKYALIILLVLILSFSIMVVRSDQRTLFDKLIKYQRESYNSAMVINDFSWKSEYPINAMLDTIIAPIPRSLWSDKPYVGMYNRYWRDKYESTTVRYHTSTYGFIAEAYMVGGFFGAYLYGFIFSLLVFSCYVMLLRSKSILFTFVPIYLTTLMYFFMRTGFTGFVFINVLFTIFVCFLLLNKSYKVKF